MNNYRENMLLTEQEAIERTTVPGITAIILAGMEALLGR